MTELSERTGVGRVHSLRHSFVPSGPLTELIEEFTESTVRIPFLFRSTKVVNVDSLTYLRGGYYEQDKFAHAAVERAKRLPFVIARVGMRMLYGKSDNEEEPGDPLGYRMAFLPADTRAFNTLADSLDIYPSAAPGSTLVRNHLFLDLPLEAIPSSNQEEAEAKLKRTIEDGLARRLYAATIVGIRSMEVAIPLLKQPDDPIPEDKSA